MNKAYFKSGLDQKQIKTKKEKESQANNYRAGKILLILLRDLSYKMQSINTMLVVVVL